MPTEDSDDHGNGVDPVSAAIRRAAFWLCVIMVLIVGSLLLIRYVLL